MPSEIDRINERIDLLKVGLSGIAKRYGYQTVQDFYRAYHTAKNAYADYQEKSTKWEEIYGGKSKATVCIREFRIIKKRLRKDSQKMLHRKRQRVKIKAQAGCKDILL